VRHSAQACAPFRRAHFRGTHCAPVVAMAGHLALAARVLIVMAFLLADACNPSLGQCEAAGGQCGARWRLVQHGRSEVAAGAPSHGRWRIVPSGRRRPQSNVMSLASSAKGLWSSYVPSHDSARSSTSTYDAVVHVVVVSWSWSLTKQFRIAAANATRPRPGLAISNSACRGENSRLARDSAAVAERPRDAELSVVMKSEGSRIAKNEGATCRRDRQKPSSSRPCSRRMVSTAPR
jgi:hypothetical protein